MPAIINKMESRKFTIFPYILERRYWNTDNQDYFSTLLPQEIIVYIFKFLSTLNLLKCSTVSKYWRTLSFSSELWKNFTVPIAGRKRIEICFLERILNCSVKVISLADVEITERTSAVEPFFRTAKFGSLQSIFLNFPYVKIELVEELISLSPDLKKISLIFKLEIIGVNFFRQILKLQFLEYLHLKYFTINDVPEVELVRILGVEKFKNLKTLSFVNVLFNLNFIRAPQSTGVFIEKLLLLCPNLEHLEMTHHYISDSAFRYIIRMKNLRILNIAEITFSVNTALLSTENCEKLVNLRELDVSDMYMRNFTERFKMSLLNLSPNLEYLHIGGLITHSLFRQIFMTKNLKHLRFCNADLTSIINLDGDEKFYQLRILYLSKFQPRDDTFLSKLLRRCENLYELELCGLDIDENSLRSIASMKELMKLNFICVSGVSNNNINDILEACPKLIRKNVTFIARRHWNY